MNFLKEINQWVRQNFDWLSILAVFTVVAAVMPKLQAIGIAAFGAVLVGLRLITRRLGSEGGDDGNH